MIKIDDLKGFAYPTPEGKASVVGDLPWRFGTKKITITEIQNCKQLGFDLIRDFGF